MAVDADPAARIDTDRGTLMMVIDIVRAVVAGVLLVLLALLMLPMLLIIAVVYLSVFFLFL